MPFTRRRFLAAGFATTAGTALIAKPFAARADTASASAQSFPAIEKLPKLSGQARPFTNVERLARIERARRLMAANKIDAILIAGGTSALYFADLRMGGSERLWALVIPAKAKPFVVTPAFEEGRAREALDAGPFGKGAEVLTWQEDESPFALVGKGLRDRGLATGTLGIDDNTKFVFADSIRAANPYLTLVSATPVTAGCRMIKDAHELDCMRLASRATLMVYRAVAQSVRAGMTNADVENLVQLGYARVGFPGEASLNIDEFTALPHGSAKPQTLREGSILMLDDGCTVQGYQSDITRTFVLGKPTDKMKKVFDIVKAAQTAALKTARPGIVAGDVDAAARKVIVDAGYGPGFTYFTHRLGHGIGMDGHEWPY
ncbi:MAG: aminopeptidase P family protein, partial [Proteobacteria bacterium]|nr:aminopeptidase P family protein [Pseudomonadota bacterium]